MPNTGFSVMAPLPARKDDRAPRTPSAVRMAEAGNPDASSVIASWAGHHSLTRQLAARLARELALRPDHSRVESSKRIAARYGTSNTMAVNARNLLTGAHLIYKSGRHYHKAASLMTERDRGMIEDEGPMNRFDTSVPNVSRIYNALLGGKDNYESDRQAASRILEIEPDSADVARQNRAFLGRVVRFLAEEKGVRQFLDIGSGLPTASNVHEVAQSCAPESRVVYVDNDVTVLAHARALLVSTPEGQCGYVHADLRDTGSIITQAAEILDFSQPVAVLLFAILHFVPDQDDPWAITCRLMDAVPPGSYLAVSHATPESLADAASKELLSKIYAETASGGVTPRPKAEIERFFNGLEMTEPGLASISAWRPEPGAPSTPTHFYGGAAQKP